MKNGLIILALIGMTTILQSNIMILKNKEAVNLKTSKIEIPEDIKVILDNSCYGCHNKESRSEKGKEKLKWDALNELSNAKQVATLEKIIEVIQEDAMPPKKFRENYPDNVPSNDEFIKILEWANNQADNIMGE